MQPGKITLTVKRGVRPGEEFAFESRSHVIIGRADDCDIRLPRNYEHSDVSRHHCVLEVDPSQVRIRDLGSANGTYVNGERIGRRPKHQPREETDLTDFRPLGLHDGDEIQVGRTVFRVGFQATSEAPEEMSFSLFFLA